MNWFHNLKIKTKLFCSFALISLICIIIGAINYFDVTQIDKADTSLYTQNTVPTSQLGLVASDFQQLRINELKILLSENPQDAQKYYDNIQNLKKEISTETTEIQKTMQTDEGRRLFKSILDNQKAYEGLLDKIIELDKADRDEESKALIFGDSSRVANAEEKAINEMLDYNLKYARETLDKNKSIAQASNKTMLIMILINICLAMGLGYFLNRNLTNTLQLTVNYLSNLAKGDFSHKIDSKYFYKDEIGQLAMALATVQGSVSKLIQGISEKSEVVSASAEQLNSGSQQITAGAVETASTMSQMASTVDNINTEMQRIEQTSGTVTHHAERGKNDIQAVDGQMKIISDSTGQVASSVDELNSKVQRIGQIIDLIDNIAGQTNLLALNAAIEAARAGDHGRGFAVVADEVRQLAEQTSGATRDIGELIRSIIEETQVVVINIATTIADVKKGSGVISEVGFKFNEIIESIQSLSENIKDVASAVEQMSVGVEGVAASVQEQTATTEELTSSAETLSNLAAELNEQVSQFKI